MRAVKSVTIDSERRVIITFLDGSTETLYPNCIWCDLEALRELIKDLLEEKADAVVQMINNVTVATFADGADDALIRKLLVNIEPIQDLHGYDSPWPAGGGKNLFDLNAIESVSGYLDNNGTFVQQASWRVSDYIAVTPDTQITISGGRTGDSTTCNCWYDANKNFISAFPATNATGISVPSNAYYLRISTLNGDLGTTQVENGNTATSYAPYENICPISGRTGLTVYRSGSDTSNPTEFPVSWETEAGTVYGGSLDVVSGKLTVDKRKINIAEHNWSKFNDLAGTTTFATTCSAIKNEGRRNELWCNIFKTVVSQYFNPSQDATITNAWARGINVNIRYDAISNLNAEEFKSWCESNGVEIVWGITPTEIQLTPQEVRTLLGVNNIWADSGDILELEYVADTKLYIGESQSGTLGSGRQAISNTDLQHVSEKTVEDLTETAEKETQEETADERGE